MPTIISNGVEIYFETFGKKDKPSLILSNSLGTDFNMWTKQIDEFQKDYYVICYDTRGHGQSEAPEGPYSVKELADDILILMDYLKLEKSHLCGLSMGGITVLYLAIHHPERIKSLILANTGAKLGNQVLWKNRIEQVKEKGMGAIADDVILRWFSKEFLDREPDLTALFKEDLALMSPEGYIGCCHALAEADLHEELNKVICPTLIIAGKADQATPVSWSKEMLEKINLAKILILDAAHLSNIEKANAFNKGVKAFLK